MGVVEITRGGAVKIPTEIRKKYRIANGARVTVADEEGVITIRPQLQEAVRLAKKSLKTS